MRNALVVGDRVYLRPLESSDAEGLARDFSEEAETFMYRGRIPVSPLAFAHWIEQLHTAQPPAQVDLAVCLCGGEEADRMIGLVNVEHIDWVNRTGETGSILLPARFRGQGYGTEAKHLLLEYAFDRLHLHVLRSHVWEPNDRSAAALIKQGYRPAGRLKWDDVQNGIYRDTLVFDLLREEWLEARAAWKAGQS